MAEFRRAGALVAGLALLTALGACTAHKTAATSTPTAGAATSSTPTPTPSVTATATVAPRPAASSPASAAPTPAATKPAATATAPPPASPAVAAAKPSPLDHIAVIAMENHGYNQVIGSPSAPYTNSLAHTYALATNYFSVSHPSLPNYLSLVGGSTFGITDDCTSCHVAGSQSLANQLQAARISWTDYQEGMPSPCFTGPAAAAGQYAKKHNPFVYFDAVVNDPATCSHVVPASSLGADIAGGRLPAFTWITPNLCNDTHDCPVSTGDSYLAGLVPGLVQALGPHGALFLIYDEAEDGDNSGCCGGKAAGGHVTAILAGQGVRKGATSSVAYDHYSVLRTIEDNWGLGELGNASCACTPVMRDLLGP